MRHQNGVALIIVLLIVALVVILASEMGGRLQLNIQRVQNIKDNNQAQWYAYSAESFAEKSIKEIYEQTQDKIHIEQPWSQEFTFPLEGGGIQAQLVDMQSCFNLNALAQSTTTAANGNEPTEPMQAFHRMLSNLPREEPIESFTLDTVRDSLADWLDQDDRLRDFGAEDSEYESRSFPYLAANRLMVSQSELRIINGVSAEWVNDVWPYVCVIPDTNKLSINVNTLTQDQAPLLAGLTGLTLQQASELINRRPSDGWESATDFLGENVLQSAQLTDEQQQWFDVTTEYFILHTKTRYNSATFSMSSLFHVAGATSVSVIRREFGGIK
jgi:general secretion pathway protein K